MLLLERIKQKAIGTAQAIGNSISNFVGNARQSAIDRNQAIAQNFSNWQAQNRANFAPGGSIDTAFRQSPLAQRTADALLSFGAANIRGQLGNSGLEKYLPEKYAEVSSYRPKTTAGQITAPLGTLTGYAMGVPGKIAGGNIPLMARNAAIGAAFGGGSSAIGDLIQRQIPSLDRVREGAIQGAEGSWIYPLTNPVADKLLKVGSKAIPGLSSLTDDALSASGNAIKQGTFNQIVRQAPKQIVKGAIREAAETPLETAYFAAQDTAKGGGGYAQNYRDRFLSDLLSNALIGGVRQGAGLAPKVIKTGKAEIDADIDRRAAELGLTRKQYLQRGAITIGDGKKPTDPLIEEAKKYKSAEEFVNSQTKNKLYHVSENPNLKIDPNYSPKQGQLGKGFYVSKDSETWRGGQIGKRDYVYEIDAKDLRIAEDYPTRSELINWGKDRGYFEYKTTRKPNGEIVYLSGTKKPHKSWQETEKAKKLMTYKDPMTGDIMSGLEQQYLKDKGYDGVSASYSPDGEQSVIFNYDKIKIKPAKTKSQLIDIWNKAQQTQIKPQENNTKLKTIDEVLNPSKIEEKQVKSVINPADKEAIKTTIKAGKADFDANADKVAAELGLTRDQYLQRGAITIDGGKKKKPTKPTTVEEILQPKTTNLVAERVKTILDYLPDYKKELQETLKQSEIMMKQYDLIKKSGRLVPDKKALKEGIKETKIELAKVSREIEKLLSNAKNTKTDFISTPKGIVKPKVNIESTKQIEDLLNLINKPDLKVADNLQLPAPKTLSLPQPIRDVTVTEYKKLAESGSNLDGVRKVVVKNANEARDALKAGVPGNKIEILKKAQKSGKEMFAGEYGISKRIDQADQALKLVAKQATGGDIYTRNFVERIRALPKVLGGAWNDVNKQAYAPFKQAKGDAAKFKTEFNQRAQAITKASAGSKESEYIHKFGEGIVDYDKLVKEFGESGAERIKKASVEFKKLYQDGLKTINDRRIADGLEPIKERQNYFRHIGEMNSGFWESLASNKPTGSTGSSIAKQRKGEETIYDAVGNYSNWVEAAGKKGFLEAPAKNFARVTDILEKNGANPNAVKYLRDLTDEIAGTKVEEDLGEIGNIVVNSADAVGGTIRMNKILGNVSSLIAQFGNLPQALGKNWKNPKAIMLGLKNLNKNSDAMKASSFLADRFYNTPTQFIKGKIHKTRSVAGSALKKADELPTRYIWNMFYESQKTGSGIDMKAVKYADELTELMVAGRGVGDMAPAMQNRLVGTVLPFSVEWANAFHVMSEMVKRKEIGALSATLVLNHLFNKGAEALRGSPVLFDPIETIINSAEQWVGSDKKEKNEVRAIGRLLAGLSGAHPITHNLLAALYPIAKGAGAPPSREIFGSDDPTRFGSINMYTDAFTKGIPNMAANFSPVGGGSQAMKTAGGLKSWLDGYTTSASGNVMHEIDKNPLSLAQMAFFGKWATPKSKEFFDNDFTKPLNKKQSEVYRQADPSARSAIYNAAQNKNKIQAMFDSAKPSEGNWLSRFLSKEKSTIPDDFKPSNKAERDILKSYVDTMLEADQVPAENHLKQVLFDTKSIKTNMKDRKSVLKALNSAMTNEYYSDEQKAAILKASGVSQDQWEFYRIAAMDEKDALREVLPTLGDLSDPENFKRLALMKATLGERAIITNESVQWLYNNDYINKQQMEILKALKFDEFTGKFYFNKGSKWSGTRSSGTRSSGTRSSGTRSSGTNSKPKTLTFAQAKSFLDIPKLNKIGSIKRFDLGLGKTASLMQSVSRYRK
jgi:hypothetical protein